MDPKFLIGEIVKMSIEKGYVSVLEEVLKPDYRAITDGVDNASMLIALCKVVTPLLQAMGAGNDSSNLQDRTLDMLQQVLKRNATLPLSSRVVADELVKYLDMLIHVRHGSSTGLSLKRKLNELIPKEDSPEVEKRLKEEYPGVDPFLIATLADGEKNVRRHYLKMMAIPSGVKEYDKRFSLGDVRSICDRILALLRKIQVKENWVLIKSEFIENALLSAGEDPDLVTSSSVIKEFLTPTCEEANVLDLVHFLKDVAEEKITSHPLGFLNKIVSFTKHCHSRSKMASQDLMTLRGRNQPYGTKK